MCTLDFFSRNYKLKYKFNFFISTKKKITVAKNGERDFNNKACFIMIMRSDIFYFSFTCGDVTHT